MGKKFVKEFVVGFGFLGGIFLSIGIDPEGQMIKNVVYLFFEDDPAFLARSAAIFNIFSILLLMVTLFTAYKLGRNIGLLAIFFAFIGGFLIFSYYIVGVVLLAIGLMLGYISPRYKHRFL